MIKKYTIKGLVQGIGYRPFVAKKAEELNISGWVRNTGGVVTVLAIGEQEVLRDFLDAITKQVPTGGFITSVDINDIESIFELEKTEALKFSILQSDSDSEENLPLIPADIATCPQCQAELLDPTNRRYMHPFISCTICGPRYSIIKKLPYDRDTITMGDFEMCPDCKREYEGKMDRRRHAQTIACKICGPKLEFARILAKNEVRRKFTSEISDNVNSGFDDCFYVINNNNDAKNKNNQDNSQIIERAVQIIRSGGILAIKDIGGFHLACSPFNEGAVADLRRLKHREEKALAVMFDSIEQIRKYGNVNADEAKLLESPARPIVLIKRNTVNASVLALAPNVCLTSPSIGAMLPCNPVQIMLVKKCGPLIMTSGNASGDVLEIDNTKMYAWLQERVKSGEFQNTPIAMLGHNRRILRPMDDSVMKVVRGRTQFIRRGRGHVPNPISVDIDGEVFAAGGDLKSAFCYVKKGLAYVSQHLGDLESVSCQSFYNNEQKAMKEIFGFAPDKYVADMHPGYFSRIELEKNISKLNDSYPSTLVQHHKAHVASVIAEHKLKGPVLGFAFDGTGYGDDGSIWGSEAFIWDEVSNGKYDMRRVAHLKPMKLIGGDEGAKNCDTIMIAMLHNLGIDYDVINTSDVDIITAALDNNINTVISSSMGRLFDAVSALLDICHYNTYEGQAPVELENVAAATDEFIPMRISEDGNTTEIFKTIVNTIVAQRKSWDGTERDALKAKLARGFIYAVADYVYTIVKKYNIKQVVLSGGTFLNRILLERTIDMLERDGYSVYIANQLPAGDGGLCLGQAYLSAHIQD